MLRSIAKFALLCGCSVGSTVLGHGDTHERIEALSDSLKQNPDHVASLLERADLYRRHRDFDEALADLRRVRLLSPTSNAVRYLTGLTLLEQGELKEAEVELKAFVSRSPISPRGYLALARVFTQQERHLSAAQAYELVVENQTTPTPDHYLARAHAYRAAGKPYLTRALEGLEEGIESMGPLITFQRLAVEIAVDQGNYQDAIDRVDKVLQTIGRKETWLVRKANILSLSGRKEEAEHQFLLAIRAIELLPYRTRTSPAMRTLRATINENLNSESDEKGIQHESDATP